MNPTAPPVPAHVPVRTYAEHQPEYTPIAVAVYQDGPADPYPGVYRLVTAYVPTDAELDALGTTLAAHLAGGIAPDAALTIPQAREGLRALFAAHPVVLELLSADGRLRPQNVTLGVPAWMHRPPVTS